MQSKTNSIPVDTKKRIIIAVLFFVACTVTASGLFFSIFSYINNITFQVINTQVSGIVFGVCVLYLGIRNIISLRGLRDELYKSTSRFSWDNFKKKNKAKSR
jgi:branched-subunit amino acid permease